MFVERLKRNGFDVDVIDIDSHKFHPVPFFQLYRVMRNKQVDIVHTHGARANFYGRTAARLAGVPIILSTVHNSLRDYIVSRFKKQVYLLLDRITAHFAAKIICVSRTVASDLIQYYRIDRRKIVVIPVAPWKLKPENISSAAHLKETRETLGLNCNDVVIGTVGRMTEQKGHRYLLQAVADLAEEFPQLRCLLVGDGPLRRDLETMSITLGIADRCLFTGFRDDIPAILSILNVFVLPSLSEGLPAALLEAMGAGCPVVATRVSGIPEVIDDGINGLLVEPQDTHAFADSIRYLLRNPEKARKMGLQSRRMVKERFTAEKMVARTDLLYKELISRLL